MICPRGDGTGQAIADAGLTVGGEMECNAGFTARGRVTLRRARIAGLLTFRSAILSDTQTAADPARLEADLGDTAAKALPNALLGTGRETPALTNRRKYRTGPSWRCAVCDSPTDRALPLLARPRTRTATPNEKNGGDDDKRDMFPERGDGSNV
jgi:hypothetical protein